MTDAHDPSSSPTPPPPAGQPDPGPAGGGQPEVLKRVVAAVIDAIIAGIVGMVPVAGGIAATAYWLVRDGLDLPYMDHRSLGKHVMGLRPLTLDGRPVDVAASMRRNWMFALGGVSQFFGGTFVGLVVGIPLGLLALALMLVELGLVLATEDGRRIGDRIADTRVVYE